MFLQTIVRLILQIIIYLFSQNQSLYYFMQVQDRFYRNSSQQSKLSSNKMPRELKSMLVKSSLIRFSSKSSQSNKGYINNFFEQFHQLKKCSLCEIETNKFHSIFQCMHQFCLNCLQNYIKYKVSVGDDIICPQQNCLSFVNENSKLFKDLPQKILTKYYNTKLWKQNINNPEVKLCPNQQCREGLIDLKLNPPQCRKCKRKCCKICEMDFHQGPCDQNFQNVFNQWKRCPQCRSFIEKTEGCNHMTCLCEYQFCFICLDPWSDDHFQCGQEGLQDYYEEDEDAEQEEEEQQQEEQEQEQQEQESESQENKRYEEEEYESSNPDFSRPFQPLNEIPVPIYNNRLQSQMITDNLILKKVIFVTGILLVPIILLVGELLIIVICILAAFFQLGRFIIDFFTHFRRKSCLEVIFLPLQLLIRLIQQFIKGMVMLSDSFILKRIPEYLDYLFLYND